MSLYLMTARINSLIFLIIVSAVHICAQQTDGRLDSIIKTLDLKEVIVTAKKIRQSEDTVSYSASTYINKNDKTLEDLLRKMPGIEVKADGQITYNGQWINEFYIEGLDMLGGNYRIATRNIDARDIGTVQVLQNNQDVKMLQGVKKGTAPAMNIKLKQNALGVWASTIQTALGIQPDFSRDVSATLMNFRRNAQNISVYKTNDTGNDLRKDIGAPSTFNSSLGTGMLIPESPKLNDRYAYRNDSHCLSVNQLFRLQEDRTLSFNLDYLSDKEKREATEQTSYLTDSLTRYVLNESGRADMRQHYVGAHAVYKLNSGRQYVSNSLAAKATFPKGEGTVNDKIHQNLSGHSMGINDVLKMNYRTRRGGIGEATMRLNYNDRRGMLRVADRGVAQMVRQRNLSADGTASAIAVAVPHFMFNLNCGLDARWQQAKTELTLSGTPDYGSQQTLQAGAHITPRLFLHYGQRFQWLTYVPAGFEYYTSRDGSWEYDKMFFSFKPYTNIIFNPSERLSFSLTSSVEESMPAPLSLMVQRRYTDYRTTVSNPYRLEARMNRTLKTVLGASLTNVLDMMFGGLTLTHVYTRDNFSRGYRITDDVIDYFRLPYTTGAHVLQGDQTFSKGFFRWNSKISESFAIGTSRSEYYVEDTMREGRSDYLRANVSFNASFARWMTFDTSNEFALSRSYTDGNANGSAKHNFTSSTSLVLWPFRQLSVMPSVIYHYNDYSSDYRNNTFLNCNVEYTLGNATLSLNCSNLLDNKFFRRFNDNGIVQYSSRYRLRGRTVMLGVRIRVR